MLVAVSATGPEIDRAVHSQFGRCDCFLLVDSETLEARSLPNAFSGAASGAGTACVQMLFDEKIEAVISGQVGPKAYEALQGADVPVYICPQGLTVREALQRFSRGDLRKMEIQHF